MDVVRRGSVGAVVAGLVLLGSPAWAQEDPCAPGPDGAVPQMCQSGPGGSDTGTVGMEPEDPGTDPCPAQPVEPGDGVVSDDDQGVAVGEPSPGTEPGTEPDPAPEGASEPGRVDPEQGDPATSDTSREGEDGVVCAFAVPISAPAAPESAAGGSGGQAAPNEAVAAGQLPRTGPYDQVLAVAAVGAGLLLAGAATAAAGRRRTT
jgi:hypothetical protein